MREFLILNADGNSQNRVNMMEILNSFGATVKEAKNGKEVIEWVNKENFDTIILDYELPDYDSIELIPIIREITDSPIIVITENGDETIAVKALKAGAVDYICKNKMGMQSLKNSIAEAIENREQIDIFNNIRSKQIEKLQKISCNAKNRCYFWSNSQLMVG